MNEFPKAIIHVDGDAFFVGCELASKPWLRGLPVISGAERGIASALSYEAKARGVRRGMSVKEIREICPDVVVIPSDYDTYSMYSKRMVEIVRRYTNKVEHYSIDECFAEITGMDTVLRLSYEEIAHRIKNDLDIELGTTFSIGLSVNKVLAKSASSFRKPSGFSVVSFSQIHKHLAQISIGKIWGIGRSGSVELTNQKIFTAEDLAMKSDEWMRMNTRKPLQEIHRELNGGFLHEVNVHSHDAQKSIMCTRTFRPSSKNMSYVFSELSKNIEEACMKLRRLGLCTRNISFFIKTKDFRYLGSEIKLVTETCHPEIMIREIYKMFSQVFLPGILYRATGIRLNSLRPMSAKTLNLFEDEAEDKKKMIYGALDTLSDKFGEHSLFLGSSFKALRGIKYEKKKIGIPSLGEVR